MEMCCSNSVFNGHNRIWVSFLHGRELLVFISIWVCVCLLRVCFIPKNDVFFLFVTYMCNFIVSPSHIFKTVLHTPNILSDSFRLNLLPRVFCFSLFLSLYVSLATKKCCLVFFSSQHSTVFRRHKSATCNTIE